MTKTRYYQIFDNLDEKLTPEEIQRGWHFCCEWDGLLVSPSMDESFPCCCYTDQEKEQQVPGYLERKKEHDDEMEEWAKSYVEDWSDLNINIITGEKTLDNLH